MSAKPGEKCGVHIMIYFWELATVDLQVCSLVILSLPPFFQIPGVDWNQWCETLLLAAAVLACCEQECLPVLCGEICRGMELGGKWGIWILGTWGSCWHQENLRKSEATVTLLSTVLRITFSWQLHFRFILIGALVKCYTVTSAFPCSAVPPGDSLHLNSSLQEFQSLWNASFVFKANWGTW